MALTKKEVKKRLGQARKTLRNLSEKKEKRINISRENLITYCNETIMLCEIILALMKKQKGKKKVSLGLPNVPNDHCPPMPEVKTPKEG